MASESTVWGGGTLKSFLVGTNTAHCSAVEIIFELYNQSFETLRKSKNFEDVQDRNSGQNHSWRLNIDLNETILEKKYKS